ncbi:MAG: methyltransferase domain-containing protein [Chthoniobacter sp.]|uniref:class I SAM-dependent methyltransferase n=1 Tax=Chthoniobacter sp. TaxID=2510640 RepID=UPI0032AC37DC
MTDCATSEARARQSLGISGGNPYYAWAVRGLEEDLPRATAILDLGCGVGHFGKFLQDHFGQRPHGIDVIRHPGFLEESYASFALHDLNAPLPTERSFDFIFALGLIEYIPNPRAFFHSVAPLLASGGRLVITAPNPASLRSLLSLAVRGEFSAFRKSSNPASITPVLPVDAQRMLREAHLPDPILEYSASGRIPVCRELRYQQLLPFLRGRLWSDDFCCIARSPVT